MAKKKLPKNLIMWIVGILFVMSMLPGEGTRAANQQAIVATEYTCSSDNDCPICVGKDLIEYNETDPTFLGELSYAECVEGVCYLSDACLVWDCPTGSSENCKSVKQTILDNTLLKFNDNPIMLLLIIGLIVAYFMLQ